MPVWQIKGLWASFKHPSPHKPSETFHWKLCYGKALLYISLRVQAGRTSKYTKARLVVQGITENEKAWFSHRLQLSWLFLVILQIEINVLVWCTCFLSCWTFVWFSQRKSEISSLDVSILPSQRYKWPLSCCWTDLGSVVMVLRGRITAFLSCACILKHEILKAT